MYAWFQQEGRPLTTVDLATETSENQTYHQHKSILTPQYSKIH